MSNITFKLVEGHPLVGRSFNLVVVGVYSNPDRGFDLVKLKNPDGSTQFRQYNKPQIYETVDVDRLV